MRVSDSQQSPKSNYVDRFETGGEKVSDLNDAFEAMETEDVTKDSSDQESLSHGYDASALVD